MAPSLLFSLLVLLAHFTDFMGLVGAQVPDVQHSCPAGFVVQQAHSSADFYCELDPCYGSENPCGRGNTCNTELAYEAVVPNCVCNPPYLTGTVPYPPPGYNLCYLEGDDPCNPNPCQNGGTCSYLTDAQGTNVGFTCDCGPDWAGATCNQPPICQPIVTASVNGVSGPLAYAINEIVCGNSIPPIGCLYADNTHFLCCENTSECGPLGADGVPICPAGSYVPSLNIYTSYTPLPPCPPPSTPPAAAPNGDQGVCGTGDAAYFPTRCWFNNDPQGRYVCCDANGCDGFTADNLTPNCANYGYVPPNDGLSGPPSAPPTGDQGVCGTGDAAYFPTRCWFNNDPQGRYVCCDANGCDGFNADNLTPHCTNYGYVPPNYGLS